MPHPIVAENPPPLHPPSQCQAKLLLTVPVGLPRSSVLYWRTTGPPGRCGPATRTAAPTRLCPRYSPSTTTASSASPTPSLTRATAAPRWRSRRCSGVLSHVSVRRDLGEGPFPLWLERKTQKAHRLALVATQERGRRLRKPPRGFTIAGLEPVLRGLQMCRVRFPPSKPLRQSGGRGDCEASRICL